MAALDSDSCPREGLRLAVAALGSDSCPREGLRLEVADLGTQGFHEGQAGSSRGHRAHGDKAAAVTLGTGRALSDVTMT